MYKLEFILKQHTPIIHFQHDQEGATLRASEVKPKLDQFIIEKCLRELVPIVNFNDALEAKEKFKTIALNKIGTNNKTGHYIPEWRNWLVGKGNGDHIALDYKLKVSPLEKQEDYVFSSLPNSSRDQERTSNISELLNATYIKKTQHFADNEYIDKIDKFSKIRKGISHNEIKLTFFCFNLLLRKSIIDSYSTFFVINTFGTRQSKGFGCFLPKNITNAQIITSAKTIPEITGIFQKATTANAIQKLQNINELYSLLKRGKSHNGYEKSKLWEHFCCKYNNRWEKRKIKIHIKNNDINLFNQLQIDRTNPVHRTPTGTIIHSIDDCRGADNSFDYKYIRALLGLAEQYEFALNIPDNKKIKVIIKDSLKDNQATKNLAIDRFKSPIHFIINETSIFIITYKIPKLLSHYIDNNGNSLIRPFKFTIDKMITNKSFTLEIPSVFDLPQFIETYAHFGNNLKQSL